MATPFTPKGDIALPSHFPAAPAAGDVYRIIQDVLDNDPSKTNTGDLFQEGEHIYWNAPNSVWRTFHPRQYRIDDNLSYQSEDTLLSKAKSLELFTLLGLSEGGVLPILLRFDFTQGSAASTWTIAHNLGKHPNISIYTVGGVEVEAAIIHLSSNVAQILFDAPFSGYAVCLA